MFSSAHSVKVEPKFKTWKDVPDSMVPTTSARDPGNPLYRHPRWIKLKKQQIWAQQINRPVYLLFTRDKYLLGGMIITMVILQVYLYYLVFKEEYEAVSRVT